MSRRGKVDFLTTAERTGEMGQQHHHPHLHQKYHRGRFDPLVQAGAEIGVNECIISPDAISGVLGDLIAPIFSPGLPSLMQKVHQI